MLLRILKVVLGLALVVAGALLGLVPGAPGFPLVLLGAALVLAQSEPGRRTLARIRLWARGRFGSEPVRRVERRFPKDVLGPHSTTEMRIDLEEYERRRRRRRRGGSR